MFKKKNLAEGTAEKKEKKTKVKFKYLPKEKKKKILIRGVSTVLILALLALGGFYLYKLLMNTVFKPNDVFYKDSYTVSDKEAIAKKDVVVATAGGEELTNGLLKMFYWKQISNFAASYGDYLAIVKLDLTKPLDKQLAVGATDFTWQQYFLEGSVASWQRYLALYKAGVKADVGLPEDLQEEFAGLYDELTETAKENGYETVEALIHDEIGVGVSYEDYLAYFEMYYLGLAYYDSMLKSVEVSMEEIEAYYAENSEAIKSAYGAEKNSGLAGTVRHILIKPVDADEDGKYSSEEWAICLAKAEKLLQDWKDANGDETSFAELAKEHSEDPGSSADGGLYEGIYKGYGFVESFENWATDKTHAAGDTGIIQSSHGYHIMYYVSGEDAWITCSRLEVRDQKLVEKMNEAMSDYIVDMDYKKVAIDELIFATAKEEEK